MITISRSRVQTLFDLFPQQKILVLGDLMMDHYIWGKVSRISPEAPVPVVEVYNETFDFGGAANVCHNVQTLGAGVIPVGVIGEDGFGEQLKSIFQQQGFPTKGILTATDRPTTVKSRVMAGSQPVVRTDRELKDCIPMEMQGRIIRFVEKEIESIDSVILEDYNKGLFSPPLISEIIRIARKHQKHIFVDPKFDNFFDFQGATLFKPNRKEAMERLGVRLDGDADLEKAGFTLLEKLKCDAVLITLGEEGMSLFEQDQPWVKVPTQAIKVHDVSGAGDTVIATIAVAMSAGANLREAAMFANYAAGIVVGEVGIHPVDRDILLKRLLLDFS